MFYVFRDIANLWIDTIMVFIDTCHLLEIL